MTDTNTADGAPAAAGGELPDPTDFKARAEHGRAARQRTPRASQGGWSPPPDRPDPVSLLEQQAATRVPELVPIRYARMLVSPFTFYRGAALIMATDLAGTPVSGITAQLCGDAHLSNFGVFGTPERRLIFDVNDFDETLPGPWEWDLKRLAASFEVAGRNNGASEHDRRAATLAVVSGYRQRMLTAAASNVLDAWYAYVDSADFMNLLESEREKKKVQDKQVKRTDEVIAKARTKDSTRAVSKLVEVVDGQPRIISDPPLIVPMDQLSPIGRTHEEDVAEMKGLLLSYQSTLGQGRRPMRDFSFVDMARKVVGVGSVGTRAWIVLLRGRNENDYLMMQAKQAEASVLERFVEPSVYDNHGERVVRGQQLMQAASDIFLGWQRVTGFDGVERDFYLRQLQDWKGAADIDSMEPAGAELYARLCGAVLAQAHARTGDRVAIAAYLGNSDRFDRAIADFARDYAAQNERDYKAFSDAVASGRIKAAATV